MPARLTWYQGDVHGLLLMALLSLAAADDAPRTAPPARAQSCGAAVRAAPSTPDPSDYWLFIPRLVLWPLRAAVRLVAEPTVALADWVERSGLGRAVSRAVVFGGGTALPVFHWESGRNPVAGFRLKLSAVYPHCSRCFFEAGGWAGGRWVWGTEIAAGFEARAGLRFLAELELSHRDDEWVDLPEFGGHRFYRRYLRAGGGLVLTRSWWLSARASGAFTQVLWGLGDASFDGLALQEDPGRSGRPAGPFDEFTCGVAELAVFLGRANPAALGGSSVRMRSASGPGAVAFARWYQGAGVGGVASAELRAEAWWTLGLGGFSDAQLTFWGLVWYLHERGQTALPMVLWPRLGGFQWVRGVRSGQLVGHAVGFASLEYRLRLHRRVQGLVFLDYGAAGGPRFEGSKWDVDSLTPGGRLTVTLVGPWAMFVQAGVSGTGRFQAAVGLGRY